MAGQHQGGLRVAPSGAVELPLSWMPRRSGRPEEADEGDCRDAGAVRLSPHPRAAPVRRLGRERKRIYQLYKEMGLQLRHEPPKRRVKAKLREGRCAASCSNELWAMNFVHDQLASGLKLRIPDGGRHLQPVLAGGGTAVPLSGARCRGGARTGMRRGGLSGVNPRRPGQRVHLTRPGPVGGAAKAPAKNA